LTTRISTIRQPKCPGANAAVGFARTSVDSARWIESTMHWTPALYSWPLERQVSWSPPPVSPLKSTVGHGRSTWDRRSLRTHLHFRNAIWGKPGKYCQTCSGPFNGVERHYCSFAYSALASFRMGMSGSASPFQQRSCLITGLEWNGVEEEKRRINRKTRYASLRLEVSDENGEDA
jgi:hypothetical protein